MHGRPTVRGFESVEVEVGVLVGERGLVVGVFVGSKVRL